MSDVTKVNFVLCWHMHQPWYQQGIDGDYQLPWVYLHAIKDYDDMAAHLEASPNMQVVVNFAPVLLEQLDDYTQQLRGWLDEKTLMRDPMLNLLAGATDIPVAEHERYLLICECQRAHAPKMIDPYPAFRKLLDPFAFMFPEHDCPEKETGFLKYLNDQYFKDLLVWYHLAWLGHYLKQSKIAQRLIKKAKLFDDNDCRELIELISDCISGLIPRYRKLAERKQIELSMTPYGHPIIPLLNDFNNMQCSQPDSPLPDCDLYPGGKQRSRWHIEKGIECIEHYFGMKPCGIWLSEGAISEDAVKLVEDYGFKWTASGEGVWRSSTHMSDIDPDRVHSKRALFHCYQLKSYKPKIFFRDDGLSDLIGFEYANRNSVEAAEDLVQNLVNIADFLGDSASQHVVSIILDGENAWEYYPHNGYHFLHHLYQRLSGHSHVNATHYSEIGEEVLCDELSEMCAGSWVYGSFSTWIGHEDKNRAWELLVDAKKAFDAVMSTNKLSQQERERATRQLAICEGSDWFWWFGEHNSPDSVSDFDRLFRAQLKNLYTLIGKKQPGNLDTPVSYGGTGSENAGTMRRNV